MKKLALQGTTLWLLASLLSGCVSYGHPNLATPCPDYGKYCHKTPINGWHETIME